MDMQNKKWLGAGADMAARAAFSFGMCGAVAGLLYLTAQNGMTEASRMPQPVPRVATVVATLDQKPDAPQTAVTTQTLPTPPHEIARAAASQPAEIYAVIPTKRPETNEKVAAASASKVERFDTCLPDCETRDPMIVGSKSADATYPEPPVDVAMEEPVSLPVVQRAGNLLDRALEVPGDALRKGRSLITTVARATL